MVQAAPSTKNSETVQWSNTSFTTRGVKHVQEKWWWCVRCSPKPRAGGKGDYMRLKDVRIDSSSEKFKKVETYPATTG